MSIWLALWILVSAILLGFLAWTLVVLFKQKSVWKAFAEKHKLRFKPNAIMESPEIDGSIDGYKVSCFTGEHVSTDMRGFRKLTAIEVNLQSSLPIEGALASGGMVAFVKQFNFRAEIFPEHEKWNKSYIATGSNRAVLEAYLTDARLDAITKLMRINNCWVVLFFRQDRMLLRIDTTNPLISQENIEKLVTSMVKAAKTLELAEGEGRVLKAKEAQTVKSDAAVALDNDDEVKAAGGLELEDDDSAPKAGDDQNSSDEDVEDSVEPEKPSTKKS